MLLIPDPEHRGHRPVPPAQDAEHQLLRARPGHRRAYSRDPRYIAKKAEDVPASRPASPTPRTSGPKPSSTSSTRALRPEPVLAATTSSTRSRACGTPVASASSTAHRTSAYKPRYKEGYFPVPPMDQYQDLRSEMVADAGAGRHRRSRCSTTRSAPRARPRSTCASTRCCVMADKLMLYKYVVKNVALRGGQDGDVHAEADLPGQRLGHARAPVAVEGRRAAVLRREGLRRPLRHGALVHRRPAQARAGDPRVHEPDDELVQAAGAGLRGAGQPRVLAAQPLGVGAHPAVLEEPEGEAPRVPVPRPVVQPVPRVLGDAAWPASTASRTASSRRRRSTRTSTTCRPRSWRRCRRCRARSTRRSTRSKPTTTSC